jgi:emfourin
VRVEFERTGGIAGVPLTWSPAPDALPRADASQLTRLIDACRFFDLAHDASGAPAGADRFTYKITIDDGHRSHTVHVGESTAPQSLRPLIQWLTDAARRAR